MKIKEGVVLLGLKLPMRKVLVEAESIWRDMGEELVVTAGLDGLHSAGSLHYYGYALDLRNRYFDENKRKIAVSLLRERLGYEYDVVSHQTHIHVEYQLIIDE